MSSRTEQATEPIVFYSLKIENFRGFYSSQEIPLDASSVILSGPNGQGKTSLFDGIQWLILGRIPRLEELRYKKNEDYIVNIYAAKRGLLASVQARVLDSVSGEIVVARRTGNHEHNLLEFEANGTKTVGEKAQDRLREALGVSSVEKDAFQADFLSTALLEQDLVRAFLSISTSGERYELLSRILGISIVNEFVEKLSETESAYADRVKKAETGLDQVKQALSSARQQLKEATNRIESSPALAETVDRLKQGLARTGFEFLASSDLTQRKGEFLQRDIRQVRQNLMRLEELADSATLHWGKKPSSASKQLQESASQITGELDSQRSTLEKDVLLEKEAKERFEAARLRADNIRQIASLAINLLTDRCPVCDQKIDKHLVKTHLESLVAEQPGLLDAQSSYEKAHKTCEARSKRILELEAKHRKISVDIQEVENWEKRLTSIVGEFENIGNKLANLSFPSPVPNAEALGNWLIILKEWVQDRSEKARLIEELVEQLVAAQSVVDEKKQYERIQSNIKKLEQQYKDKDNELAEAKKDRFNRKKLCEGSRKAAAKVVQDAFLELRPVVQDLFSRLAPHPTFNLLSLSHDVYYKKGSTVPYAEDEQTKLIINPATGFSSAQANVAALCYFVALAFASSEADFGFILLDDALQSMDDVNVLGFADLCRFIRREKQLVISTHEDRLGNLLTRKLTPRDEPMRTLRLHFSAWDRSGPFVEKEYISAAHTEPILSRIA